MGRNKMIAKSCPKCGMQVAVASKSCKCGHTFFASRRAADALQGAGGAAAAGALDAGAEDMKRRTGRVRRSQPQFYDAQHYQKQIKRRSPKKRDTLGTEDEDYKGKEKESAGAIARRRRALRRGARPPRPAGASPAGAARSRDAAPALLPAQLARCATLLQEINRKMATVTWHPPTS